MNVRHHDSRQVCRLVPRKEKITGLSARGTTNVDKGLVRLLAPDC